MKAHVAILECSYEVVTELQAPDLVSADSQESDHRNGGSEAERSQIKSRDRVWDLAEVFTDDREVKAMLDLVPDMFESIDSTFLEPACGDGNFLVEILGRKLRLISETMHRGSANWYELALLRAVASIYAIDISEENVCEARQRMTGMVDQAIVRHGSSASPDLPGALQAILRANVVCADTLNDAHEIQFVEWQLVEGENFVRTPFPFEEPERNLFYVAPEPMEPIHYSELDGEITA